MRAETEPTTDTSGDDRRGHIAAGAELWAQIAQREFTDRYERGDWLPCIGEAFDTLPARVRELIDSGHPRSAEYWLLSAEPFAGVLDWAAFTAAVERRLGAFELVAR